MGNPAWPQAISTSLSSLSSGHLGFSISVEDFTNTLRDDFEIDQLGQNILENDTRLNDLTTSFETVQIHQSELRTEVEGLADIVNNLPNLEQLFAKLNEFETKWQHIHQLVEALNHLYQNWIFFPVFWHLGYKSFHDIAKSDEKIVLEQFKEYNKQEKIFASGQMTTQKLRQSIKTAKTIATLGK